MNVDYEIETAMSYIEKNKYSKAGDKFGKCFEYVKHTFGQESVQFEGFLERGSNASRSSLFDFARLGQ